MRKDQRFDKMRQRTRACNPRISSTQAQNIAINKHRATNKSNKVQHTTMKQKYEELEMDSVMFWSVLRTATAVVARGSSGPL